MRKLVRTMRGELQEEVDFTVRNIAVIVIAAAVIVVCILQTQKTRKFLL